ncbi:MAG TPA: hypothetical protein VMR14_22080 [Streptosporangiaceae bacterium]|nr:hypothetical protein [Streptosporangiaceae bacterium]
MPESADGRSADGGLVGAAPVREALVREEPGAITGSLAAAERGLAGADSAADFGGWAAPDRENVAGAGGSPLGDCRAAGSSARGVLGGWVAGFLTSVTSTEAGTVPGLGTDAGTVRSPAALVTSTRSGSPGIFAARWSRSSGRRVVAESPAGSFSAGAPAGSDPDAVELNVEREPAEGPPAPAPAAPAREPDPPPEPPAKAAAEPGAPLPEPGAAEPVPDGGGVEDRGVAGLTAAGLVPGRPAAGAVAAVAVAGSGFALDDAAAGTGPGRAAGVNFGDGIPTGRSGAALAGAVLAGSAGVRDTELAGAPPAGALLTAEVLAAALLTAEVLAGAVPADLVLADPVLADPVLAAVAPATLVPGRSAPPGWPASAWPPLADAAVAGAVVVRAAVAGAAVAGAAVDWSACAAAGVASAGATGTEAGVGVAGTAAAAPAPVGWSWPRRLPNRPDAASPSRLVSLGLARPPDRWPPDEAAAEPPTAPRPRRELRSPA